MHPAHSEIEKMTLPQLAEQLERDLDGRRTPVGWMPEDAVERATVERCIMALVAAEDGDGGEVVACSLDVRMRSKEQQVADRRARGIGRRVARDSEGAWHRHGMLRRAAGIASRSWAAEGLADRLRFATRKPQP